MLSNKSIPYLWTSIIINDSRLLIIYDTWWLYCDPDCTILLDITTKQCAVTTEILALSLKIVIVEDTVTYVLTR